MARDPVDREKQAAGESAADLVSDGDVVGLGTGSTAAYAIARLGERIEEGLTISGIPTSPHARTLAIDAGIPLGTLHDATPTIVIDGADQVGPTALVKGGGGAHTAEKLVAAAADRVIIVCDHTKRVDTLTHPVPVEALPQSHQIVESAVEDIGGTANIRTGQQGPIYTTAGNLIIDCDFGSISDPASLSQILADIPGVIEHGLFIDMVDKIHWGENGGTVRVESRQTG